MKLNAAIDITSLPIIPALTRDYLAGKKTLQPLYSSEPTMASITKLIDAKKNFPFRETLVTALTRQYAHVDQYECKQTLDNIKLLATSSAFTITCGHQLNILTGPLYFIYKICSTISTCHMLKLAYPDYDFIPVYWMASEDHDIAEINHLHIKDKAYAWNTAWTGAAGLASIEGISKIIDEIKIDFPEIGKNETWNSVITEAYSNTINLSQATHKLVHALFGKYGLVIVDGMDAALKRNFIPVFKKEISTNFSHHAVIKTNNALSDYALQVTPRELNLFYLGQNSRERIISEGGNFKLLNSNKQFTNNELLDELEKNPERFSPNVVLRPLYQEYVLPNLAYIGGPGEVAYWLQLKAVFDETQTPFPMLLLRDSFLLLNQKLLQTVSNEAIEMADLMQHADVAINKWVDKHQEQNANMEEERKSISKIFEEIKMKAVGLDKTLEQSVNGELQKTLKSIDAIEDKMRRALKRQHETSISKIRKMHETIFPANTLQERHENFSWHYAMNSESFIDALIKACNPFEMKLKIMEY